MIALILRALLSIYFGFAFFNDAKLLGKAKWSWALIGATCYMISSVLFVFPLGWIVMNTIVQFRINTAPVIIVSGVLVSGASIFLGIWATRKVQAKFLPVSDVEAQPVSPIENSSEIAPDEPVACPSCRWNGTAEELHASDSEPLNFAYCPFCGAQVTQLET